MTPDAGETRPDVLLGRKQLPQVFKQGWHGFREVDVLERDRKEFPARIAVLLEGGLVNFKERERFEVKYPHRGRVPMEHQTILLLTFAQFGFGLFAVAD